MKSTVTIIIIAKNEENNLPNVVDDIKKQTYPLDLIDLIFVDSNSKDNTKAIMEVYSEELPLRKVRVFDNPMETQASGWNIGLKNFNTDYVVRIDAHSSITENFIEENVRLLDNGEDVTGGPRPNIVNPNDKNHLAEYLLVAEKALFGSSFAYYRSGKEEKHVKSVFHGMLKREVVEKVGYVNEALGRTEDNDFYYRVRKSGFKILYSPKIISYQYARNTISGIIKQKFDNGYWIGKTVHINPYCLSPFHFIPVAFLILTLLSLLYMHVSYIPFLTLYGIYAIFILLNAIFGIHNEKLSFRGMPVVLFLFLTMHILYGAGTLKGFIYGFSK